MPRTIPRLSALFLLMAPSALAIADAHDASTPSAAQIVRNVVATYGAMTSYRDRGVSIEKLGKLEGELRREFETLFKRPDKLRFAWDEEWTERPGKLHCSIWSDGTSAWSSYAQEGNTPQREESLSLAVAGATGISGAAAHFIPRLLTNEVTGVRIDQLGDYSVTGEESIDGVDCVQLSARYRDGSNFTMWVGRDDSLIRKIATDWSVETRTGIVVNSDISDSAFKE